MSDEKGKASSQRIAELLAEIESVKAEDETKTKTKIKKAEPAVIVQSEKPVETKEEKEEVVELEVKETDFTPIKRDYIFVRPVIWHPKFVLSSPPEKMNAEVKRHLYYLNCTEAEKEAILKATSTIAEGTTYPKYHGLYDPTMIHTEYVIGGTQIAVCLLIGKFSPELLAKEDVYLATAGDIEEAKKLTTHLAAIEKHTKRKWKEDELFRYHLRHVTSKARALKGI